MKMTIEVDEDTIIVSDHDGVIARIPRPNGDDRPEAGSHEALDWVGQQASELLNLPQYLDLIDGLTAEYDRAQQVMSDTGEGFERTWRAQALGQAQEQYLEWRELALELAYCVLTSRTNLGAISTAFDLAQRAARLAPRWNPKWLPETMHNKWRPDYLKPKGDDDGE